jgi:cell wall-associated NlpC family hydrolase
MDADLFSKTFEAGAAGPDKFDCYTFCAEYFKRKGMGFPPNPAIEVYHLQKTLAEKEAEFIPIDKPEPDCLVVFAMAPPYVNHCGIVLECRNRFVHIMKHRGVCIERLDNLVWKRRIKGYYRHVEI